MAKAASRDRNEVARLKALRNTRKDTWQAADGRVIKLKRAELLYIQMATASVEMPERPTYTVKSGKIEREYPLDEIVIEQTTDPMEKAQLSLKLKTYLEELGAAYSEIAKRSSAALFLEGTIVDDQMVEDDVRWRKRMKITGWPIPSDPEERWVRYLQTSLSEKEIEGLATAVASFAGGATEEMIGAAENTFSDTVSPDTRSGDVEDAGADTQGA